MMRDYGGPEDRKRPLAPVSDVLAAVLKKAGLTDRVAQASVIPEWPHLVGAQIAAVTEPLLLQQDGTLVVMVRTNAWMNELSLLEPELLRSLNRDSSRPPVRKLRWTLRG
jgi:predicted nucleic acid-binding Zn ribbon protein